MNAYFYLLFCLLTIAFGYLVFRLFVRKEYRQKGKLTNFATFLEFLIFAAHGHLSYTFLPAPYPEMPPLPENQIQTIIGVGLMVLGISFMLWAMSGLGFLKAFGQDTKTLNRFGFYQYTRNPQILFYGVAIIGMVVLCPSFYALGWLLVYAVIAHMMIITEEEHLLRLYKDDYEQYCEDVPRYLW